MTLSASEFSDFCAGLATETVEKLDEAVERLGAAVDACDLLSQAADKAISVGLTTGDQLNGYGEIVGTRAELASLLTMTQLASALRKFYAATEEGHEDA